MSLTYEVADHQPVSTSIIEAVAAHDGIDPMEVTPPLYEIIDPDALDTLFPATVGLDRQVELTYRGYRITVSAEGGRSITVTEVAHSQSASGQTVEIPGLED